MRSLSDELMAMKVRPFRRNVPGPSAAPSLGLIVAASNARSLPEDGVVRTLVSWMGDAVEHNTANARVKSFMGKAPFTLIRQIWRNWLHQLLLTPV